MPRGLPPTADGRPPHIAHPCAGEPGCVDLWPVVAGDETRGRSRSDARLDACRRAPRSSSRAASPTRAQRSRPRAAVRPRSPSCAGDVLVLVRQRGKMFEAIIRALKRASRPGRRRRPPVASTHIAVKTSSPRGAPRSCPKTISRSPRAVKSPLIGLDDEDLCSRSPCAHAEPSPGLARGSVERSSARAADARLDAMRAGGAGQRRVRLLRGASGARRRARRSPRGSAPRPRRRSTRCCVSRSTMNERRGTVASGFLARLRRSARRCQARSWIGARRGPRDDRAWRQGARGADRVPRRHDTPPAGPRPPRACLNSPARPSDLGRPQGRRSAAGRPRRGRLCMREAEDEYRRLLYVAMTRAADRLIVCGAEGERRRPDGCWYDLICEPLKPFLVEETDGEDKVFRYRTMESPVEQVRRPRSPHARAAGASDISEMASRAGAASDRAARADRAVFGLRRRIRACRAAWPKRRGAPQSAGTRPHRASTDAVFARYCPRAARRGVRACSSRAPQPRLFRRRTGQKSQNKSPPFSTITIRRNLSAQQPRRGADRRPYRVRRRASASVPDRSTAYLSAPTAC